MGGISCSSETEPVNSQYLDSKQYQRFSADLEEEKNFQVATNSLRSSLQLISQCPKIRELKLPVLFNTNSNTLSNSYNPIQCKWLEVLSKSDYTIEIVGFTKHSGLFIRWIMVRDLSAYKNKRLLAVTYNDGRLQNFRSVGVFENNLSRKITTSISVKSINGKVLISSQIDQDQTYPIRQQDSQSARYIITTGGNIIEQ
ncbi:hypothetical protein LX73_0584 [Fodinibius salinus]|uniref:Uncharacterized protein n=2 Tax=Fodinibius salinus TaxID=860790 RepID=A0A5D3YMB1_9BACT|nr:hypothetical protein LX73_0584 [Fodinibius salinus]